MSKRSSILLVTSCALALGAFGCGSDTVQAPVDTVSPIAVLDLDATVVVQVNGAPSIELVWADSPEADLAGYNVYRSVEGGPSTLVGVETAATFRDGAVRAGDSYLYEVSAFDNVGNESPRVTSSLVRIQDGAPDGPRDGEVSEN